MLNEDCFSTSSHVNLHTLQGGEHGDEPDVFKEGKTNGAREQKYDSILRTGQDRVEFEQVSAILLLDPI